MICCCAARPTRYKQRRQPCRTINSHKPSCHHSMHKSLVKTTLLMGHRGFYGSCTSADMGYRGLFQSRRYPSLASITTCSSSCLLPCRGSGIPSSWVLPLNFLVNPTPLDSLAMQSWTVLLVQLPSEREPLWKAPLWRCLSSPQRSGRTSSESSPSETTAASDFLCLPGVPLCGSSCPSKPQYLRTSKPQETH